jgi:hypothetical protein
MIAFRDILIFAGLAALAAAVIASLFPAGEGASPVPACSDCAFKLTGGYWIRQYDNYAALYLGTREVARYGWAYRADGRPLSIGESVTCDTAMYLWVMNGVAYVSCDGTPPKFGRDVLGTAPLPIRTYFDSDDLSCSFSIEFDGRLARSETVSVYVYDEEGQLVTSATGRVPGSVSFSLPKSGVFRVHIYAPPSLDEWRTAVARVRVDHLLNAEVFASSNTDRLPYTSLKIFDLTDYWKKGYRSVTVYVNPAGRSFTLSAPAEYFADFLLAWEECLDCSQRDDALYVDEVWRVTITQTAGIYTHISTQGSYQHLVYADRLIWDWPWGQTRYEHYVLRFYDIPVYMCSLSPHNHDPDNCDELAEVDFVRECRWG